MCKKVLVLVLVGCLASVASAVSYSFDDAALLAYYNFNEGSGTTLNDSAGANSSMGIVNQAWGAPSTLYWTAGKEGSAYNFHREQWAYTSNLGMAAGNAESIAFWFKFDPTVSAYGPGEFNSNPPGYASNLRPVGMYSMDAPANEIQTYWSAGAGDVIAVCQAQGAAYQPQCSAAIGSTFDYEWHHMAIVRDAVAGTLDMYLDGTVIGGATGNNLQVGAHAWLFMASNVWGGAYTDQHFGGAIDEFRVYTKALTSAQVGELAGIPEPATMALLGLGALVLRRGKR